MNHNARAVKYQSPRDYQVANFASRTMRWTGIIVAAVRALAPRRPHVGHGERVGNRRRVRARRRLRQRRAQLRACPGVDPLHRRQHRPRHPPLPRRVEPVPVPGLEQPAVQQVAPHFAIGFATIVVVGNVSFPIAVLAGIVGELNDDHARSARPREHDRLDTPRLDSKIPDGPDGREVGQLQGRREVGQPQQQAQVQDHRRRHRPGRRVRRGDARRARLPGRRVHVPRLAAPRPLDRRAGRHQRGEELPRRRRQRSTACSTTRSRAATSAPARATCTASPR